MRLSSTRTCVAGQCSRSSMFVMGLVLVLFGVRSRRRSARKPLMLQDQKRGNPSRLFTLVGRLKEYRRIVARYDKLAESYLAFVHLAIRLWL
jgi:hypothetical protein